MGMEPVTPVQEPRPPFRQRCWTATKAHLRKYVPMELFGMLTALLGGLIAYMSTGNLYVTFVAVALSENVGFYGYAIVKEIDECGQPRKDGTVRTRRQVWAAVARNMTFAFLLAEIADSLLRSVLMSLLYQACSAIWAIVWGKLIMDAIFLLNIALGNEARKQLFEE